MKSIDDIAEDLAFIVKAGEQWIVSDFSMDTRHFHLTAPTGHMVTFSFDHVADPEANYQLFVMAPIQVKPPFKPMAQLSLNF